MDLSVWQVILVAIFANIGTEITRYWARKPRPSDEEGEYPHTLFQNHKEYTKALATWENTPHAPQWFRFPARQDTELPPKLITVSNPGNTGHHWAKDRFVKANLTDDLLDVSTHSSGPREIPYERATIKPWLSAPPQGGSAVPPPSSSEPRVVRYHRAFNRSWLPATKPDHPPR